MIRLCNILFLLIFFAGLPLAHAQENANSPQTTLIQSDTNIDKAQRIFETLLERTPDDPDIYKYLGDIHATKNNKEEAKRYYKEYIRRQPLDYYPHYRLGEMALAAEKPKEAKADFEQAILLIEPAPEDLIAQTAHARMLALLGNQSSSDELFEKLLTQNPDNPDIKNTYVDTLIETKRLDIAANVIPHYVAEHPDHYALNRNLARTYALQHKYKEARKELKRMMQEYPDDLDLQSDYAYSYYNEGDWYRAVPLFEDLSAKYPNNLDFIAILDDLFLEYRPRILGGFTGRIVGDEWRYGPYAKFVYPINTQWTAETGYSLEYNTADIPGYNPNYSTFTHDIDMIGRYKPHRTLVLSGGLINQLVGSSYAPAPYIGLDWNRPPYSRIRVNYTYNQTMDDPTSALYFDGKRDYIDFLYEGLFWERLMVATGYQSNWYRINGAKAAMSLGDSFGREDVADLELQFVVYKKPQIRLGYGFHYSKLHVVNNYLNIIPLIQESERHVMIFGFLHDWNKWITTDFTAYLGADPKRDISLPDLYAFAISNRVRVSKRFEIAGNYEYSSESPQNVIGKYQYFGVDFIYRF
ncbi:MAG: tetratricopeptide repeat protein [Pseudomonadota bacterium]